MFFNFIYRHEKFTCLETFHTSLSTNPPVNFVDESREVYERDPQEESGVSTDVSHHRAKRVVQDRLLALGCGLQVDLHVGLEGKVSHIFAKWALCITKKWSNYVHKSLHRYNIWTWNTDKWISLEDRST